MEKEIAKKRKEEFQEFVLIEERLPRPFECNFKDGTDMRLWFDGILILPQFSDYIKDIKILLESFEIKVLSDEEKEEEFIDYVKKADKIPVYAEMFFTDYSDMNSWYMSYKNKHDDFQTKVHSLLSEYREFDICKDWFFVKDEFMEIINKLKRIPEHGEVVTQNGIDVRTIFDKLSTSIPVVAEELLLRISFSKDHHLSFDERKKEFLEAVEELGYVPEIRERRFSDDVDMFTWYVKYRDKIKGLREKVEFLIGKKKNNNVNVYLIPNYSKNGGKFYTICTNVGEKIDLDGVATFDDLKKKDVTVKKRGGVILKNNEEIVSVSFVKKKK